MKFRVEHRFACPEPRDVFAALRAFAPTAAERLPNISRVEVLEDDGCHRRLKWVGRADLPRAARAVIKPDDLYWYEDGDWDLDACRASYRLHRPGVDLFGSEAEVTCTRGRDGLTRVEVAGDIRFRMPAVGRVLERVFAKHATENLEQSFRLVEADAPWE